MEFASFFYATLLAVEGRTEGDQQASAWSPVNQFAHHFLEAVDRVLSLVKSFRVLGIRHQTYLAWRAEQSADSTSGRFLLQLFRPSEGFSRWSALKISQ